MADSAAAYGGSTPTARLSPQPAPQTRTAAYSSALTAQRSSFHRLWQRLPASLKRPRNILLAISVPLLASAYLSHPNHPLHQRVDALLDRLPSALLTYQHAHNQRRLFASTRGDTLDLSPSPAQHLPSLPQHLVYGALVGNPWLVGGLAEAAEGCGYPAGVIGVGYGDAGVELRKLASDSKDAVIASMLCSARRGPAPVVADGNEAVREEEWQSLLRECNRVLKPGGRLYVVDYTAQSASSHPLSAALQRLLSPLSRLVLHNAALDTPVAQHILEHADEWDAVHLERWPAHGAAVPLTLSTAADGRAEVDGLGSGIAVLVGGVCVKRKAARLTEYVRGRETSMLDELLKFGTFNSTRQPQPPPQQQHQQPRR